MTTIVRFGSGSLRIKISLLYSTAIRYFNEEPDSDNYYESFAQNIVTNKEKHIRSCFVSNWTTAQQLNDVNTVTGVHIESNYVSWAKAIVAENTIIDLQIAKLPTYLYKYDLVSLCLLAEKVVDQLPRADRYILEDTLKPAGGVLGRVQLASTGTRMQFAAMIAALLNHRNIQNDTNNCCISIFKPRIPARIFNILLGSEQINSDVVVRNILFGKEVCHCKPLPINSDVTHSYVSRSNPVEKELLGKSVLITVAFLNIAIFQNDAVISNLVNRLTAAKDME